MEDNKQINDLEKQAKPNPFLIFMQKDKER